METCVAIWQQCLALEDWEEWAVPTDPGICNDLSVFRMEVQPKTQVSYVRMRA